MYEIIKSFNDTTKLAMNGNRAFVLKKIMFEDTELYRRLSKINCINVVRIYEIVRIGNDFYAVTEFVQGITLSEYIKKNGVMDDVKLRDVVLQLCTGLDAVHALGIIHRDINPNNIMIDDNGVIRIIDFGISRITKVNQTADTQILGTQGYAAPEQFGFSQTSIRSDVYSVGVLMNFLKTGKLPSEKADSGAFASVIIKCTQMDEKNRYKNMAELADDISKKNRLMSFIRSIPGFRENKLWHKITAVIYYLAVLLLIIVPPYDENYTVWKDLAWDVFVFLTLIIPVPVLLNQWNWQDRAGFIRNKTRGSKIAISFLLLLIPYLLGCIIIVLFA